MKKAFLIGVCLLLTVTSIGCSTIKGVGEDLGAVGGWVTRGSDSVREGK